MKRRSLYIGLLFLVISTTGCVYLRLLQVKNQLSSFNGYFRIKDDGGLTLVFLRPVLLTGDILWLMESAPLSKKKEDEGELWKYVLRKEYPSEKKGEDDRFDIPILMLFKEGKLVEITFPERFLRYVSKPLLIKMFTSMGSAEIDRSNRRAGSRFQAKDSLEIPRKGQVVSVLGAPFSIRDSGHTAVFTYLYSLEEESGSNGGGFKLVMGFRFQNDDDRLLSAETNLRGLKMSLDFSLDDKGKKP